MIAATVLRRLGVLVIPALLAGAMVVASPSALADPAACTAAASFSGGAGTAGDPFQVATAEELSLIGADSTLWDDHFVQTADIDLAACLWRPIGDATTPFVGSFDGAGFSISNLYFDDAGARDVGMFGVTFAPNEIVITDLHLVGVNIRALGNVGAIAGTNGGILTRSSASGVVIGGAEVNKNGIIGGLVGENGRRGDGVRPPALISYSLSQVNVTSVGGRFVGGLVGYNRMNSSIIDSYARGTVTGAAIDVDFGAVDATAGFAGYNGINSTIGTSYATGATTSNGLSLAGFLGENDTASPPGVVTASFWDSQTTGQSSSAGGTGGTTAELTSIATFQSAGWAIVPGWAAFNTGGPVWGICPAVNDGYPYLLWEYSVAPCDAPAPDPNPVPKFTG